MIELSHVNREFQKLKGSVANDSPTWCRIVERCRPIGAFNKLYTPLGDQFYFQLQWNLANSLRQTLAKEQP